MFEKLKKHGERARVGVSAEVPGALCGACHNGHTEQSHAEPGRAGRFIWYIEPISK